MSLLPRFLRLAFAPRHRGCCDWEIERAVKRERLQALLRDIAEPRGQAV